MAAAATGFPEVKYLSRLVRYKKSLGASQTVAHRPPNAHAAARVWQHPAIKIQEIYNDPGASECAGDDLSGRGLAADPSR